MTLKEYQKLALKTAGDPALFKEDWRVTQFCLGIVDEYGELCGKVKKVMRGDPVAVHLILKEIGDVAWYMAVMMYIRGIEIPEEYAIKTYPSLISVGKELIYMAADVGVLSDLLSKEIASSEEYIDGYFEALMGTLNGIARFFGSTLEECLEINIEKLRIRQEDDKIKGSGDIR